jgi:hypothetical protein
MESVQTASSPSATPADVLHNEHHSSLTPEEIAKALAHHNHRHSGDHDRAVQAAAKDAKKHK